jgi:hypothetical protein
MSLISEGTELLGLINKGANAELYTKLGKYIDETFALYRERERLNGENRDLREQLRFKGTIVRVKGITFIDGDPDAVCGRCADVENRPVHLVRILEGTTCPQCKTKYETRHVVAATQARSGQPASIS